jgi:Putative metal-binding motif
MSTLGALWRGGLVSVAIGATPALAASDTFIYYNSDYITAADVSDLKAALTAAGATVTTSTSSTWATSWSEYKLVIILLPAKTFSSSQISALQSMVNDGGRLVVSGDSASWAVFDTINGYVDDLMSGLGTGLSFGTTNIATTGCTKTTKIATDGVTDGVSGIYIASGTAVRGGTQLVGSGSNGVLNVDQASGAPAGREPYDVMISGDVNLFLSSCSGTVAAGSNETLWENLYNGLCADADGDGHRDDSCGGDDCDDGESSTNPAATEVPYDGVDNDCDGSDLTDVDGDSYDSDAVGGEDCDDNDAAVHPGAMETADGQDNDCNGDTDEATTWADDDGDGFAEQGGDCDDSDAEVNPAAIESCNDVDDDCDDTVDEDTPCSDDDGDGSSEDEGDCNDHDSGIGPDANEDASNGVDDDCDGDVDEGGSTFDDDGDGVTEEGGDCDDSDADINPGADEDITNSIDDDCDDSVDEPDGEDLDGDGFSEFEGDCDDSDGWAWPGATEMCDGTDNDCDGDIDEGCTAVDNARLDQAATGCEGCTARPGRSSTPWLLLPLLGLLSRRRRV